MKKAALTLIVLLFPVIFYGQRLDEESAREIGRTFLSQGSILGARLTGELHLAYKASSGNNEETYFYVFNEVGEKAFVIVSGSETTMPVLAYSLESDFNLTDIPPNMAKWLEGYKNQIRYLVQNRIEPSEEIQAEWQRLRKGQSRYRDNQRIKEVTPLIQTKWNQSPYYNALCPFDIPSNERTVSGCVATAMTQIMKFWSYPSTGTGFHSYNHAKYGTLSANFGSTTYQWSSMPNVVNSSNTLVATLTYQVGVSVDMNYGLPAEGGSGAYVISNESPVIHCAEYALETYFGYKNTLTGIQRSDYTEAQWINLLKEELDAGRPILYAGFGNGGGHAFVCDGYDVNTFFHFNWGWGGGFDGYFSVNALNPDEVGIGGGTGGFNSGQQAVIGIEPPAGLISYNLDLYNEVVPSTSIIGYGHSFSVSTNISNNGSSTFSGDYCIALFDEDSNFIDYLEIKEGYALQGGHTYSDDLIFSTDGLFSLLPGTYSLRVFYRPSGSNWTQVGDGGYENRAEITVVNPNDIEINSPIALVPGRCSLRHACS